MPDRLNQYVDPVKTRWNSLTRPQQFKLVGVIVVVILAIILTFFFIFRTRWVLLARVDGIVESMPMQAALNAENIPNRLTSDMSGIEIDARRKQDAVLAITIAGAAPQNASFTWETAFGTSGLGTTETERFHMARLAQAGALETMLTALHHISEANVILNLPNPRPFDRGAPPPTAAVTIRSTREIPPHEGRNMALVVTRAVNGLELENVTIIDQNARTVFDGTQEELSLIETTAQAQIHHRNHVEVSLTRLLSLVYHEVRPAVNYVFGTGLGIEQIDEIFTASDGFEGGIPQQREIRNAQMTGMAGGWGPGLDWNMQQFQAYQMGGRDDITASSRESFTDYHVNRRHVIERVGPEWINYDASTASVAVAIWENVREEHWLAADEERTAADWQHFVDTNNRPVMISNSTYENYEYVMSAIMLATGLQESAISLIVTRQINTIEATGVPFISHIPLIVMLAVLLLLLLMLAYGILARQKSEEEEEEGEPELSVEDLLVSTQLEEAKEEKAQELDAIEFYKDNEIKKHIEKFVNEKPEAVAALLRNWINIEEW